jgi:hypothetical protein
MLLTLHVTEPEKAMFVSFQMLYTCKRYLSFQSISSSVAITALGAIVLGSNKRLDSLICPTLLKADT